MMVRLNLARPPYTRPRCGHRRHHWARSTVSRRPEYGNGSIAAAVKKCLWCGKIASVDDAEWHRLPWLYELRGVVETRRQRELAGRPKAAA